MMTAGTRTKFLHVITQIEKVLVQEWPAKNMLHLQICEGFCLFLGFVLISLQAFVHLEIATKSIKYI